MIIGLFYYGVGIVNAIDICMNNTKQNKEVVIQSDLDRILVKIEKPRKAPLISGSLVNDDFLDQLAKKQGVKRSIYR